MPPCTHISDKVRLADRISVTRNGRGSSAAGGPDRLYIHYALSRSLSLHRAAPPISHGAVPKQQRVPSLSRKALRIQSRIRCAVRWPRSWRRCTSSVRIVLLGLSLTHTATKPPNRTRGHLHFMCSSQRQTLSTIDRQSCLLARLHTAPFKGTRPTQSMLLWSAHTALDSIRGSRVAGLRELGRAARNDT